MAREMRIRGLENRQRMESNDDTGLFVQVVEWDTTGSSQALAGDHGVAAGVGTSTSGDSAYIAGVMGNILGSALTATNNLVAGVIGKYEVTSTNASTHPKAAVIGEIGDNTTTADGAFVAVIGGDSSSTQATAAFAVANENSTPTSGFLYGLDLQGVADHGSYGAVAFRSGGADIRFNSGGLFVSLTTAITANTTTTSYAAGTLAKTTNATGRASLFVSDGSKWQFLTNS